MFLKQASTDDDDDKLDFSKPFSLARSVGMSEENKRADVAKVESLLGKTKHLNLAQTDGPTGYFGERLKQAVQRFQKDNKLKTDGVLNPGGETIRKLTSVLAPKVNPSANSRPSQSRPGTKKPSVNLLALTQEMADKAASQNKSGKPPQFKKRAGEKQVAENSPKRVKGFERDVLNMLNDFQKEKYFPDVFGENKPALAPKAPISGAQGGETLLGGSGPDTLDETRSNKDGKDLSGNQEAAYSKQESLLDQANDIYTQRGFSGLIEEYGPPAKEAIQEYIDGFSDPEKSDEYAKDFFEATIGVDPTDPNAKDIGIQALLAGMFSGKAKTVSKATAKLLGRLQRIRPTRLPETPGMTQNQIKRFGDLSEERRIASIKPKNNFKESKAFSNMSSENALASTRWPPKGNEENAFRGLAAVDVVIKDALRKGDGIVHDAMRRSDLGAGNGAITFRWGEVGAGKNYDGGQGLSKIIAKHGVEVVEDVVETIAKGKLEIENTPNGVRAFLRNGDNLAVLALDKRGKKETWLLTGYNEVKGANRHFNLRGLNGPLFFRGRAK